MTSVNQSHIHSTGQPKRKSAWGPGKNAALSFVAFAVIFGVFAYVKRDVVDEDPNITHVVSGAVDTSFSTADKHAVAASAAPAVDRATSTPQAAPRATAPLPAMMSPVTVEIEPPGAPHIEANAQAKVEAQAPATHIRPLHSGSFAVANNAQAAPAHGSARRGYGDTHRHLRTHGLASARTHTDVASRPHSLTGGTAHMQATSVTHGDLDSARALAKARSCAVLDEWRCVEQNASRALAIDPQNSESRALLGQAIRNRL